MTTYYQRSNGERVDVATMPAPHLISAIKKLEANCPPDREEELRGMREQAVVNKAAYRAELVAALATATPEEQAAIGEKIAKLDAEA